MTEFDEGFDPSEAIRILQTYENEELDSRLLEFTHYLGDRLGTMAGGTKHIEPDDVILIAVLALYDLQTGIDGRNEQPFQHPLVGLSQAEHDELLAQLPFIARLAFSDEFVERVRESMILHKVALPEASGRLTLEPGEVITEPIANLEQAKALIIEDARQHLLALDWAHYGIDAQQIAESFNHVYPLALRQADYLWPLNLLNANETGGNELLASLPEDHKQRYARNFWLVMTSDTISPELATVIRDYVFIKSAESMLGIYQQDHLAGLHYFGQEPNSYVNRAGTRIADYQTTHPEILK
ncbi:MAG: hypothetical protein JWS12_285 [Candidatus Saccharibacteria bacterium]|nr:hypothetical protein [Candidatus Saccharibacteria bacterium]